MCVRVRVGPPVWGCRKQIGGGTGLSLSVPSAFRNPQCCVQILQVRVTGTVALPSQWNGEMENGVLNLSFGVGGLREDDSGGRLRPWIEWRQGDRLSTVSSS